jgi:glycosyltransferase involved in cell wall biosynthesis
MPEPKAPLERARNAALEARLTGKAYFQQLVNHPEPHRRRIPPMVWVLHERKAAPPPLFTAVVPVFNHATTIAGCLAKIIDNAEGSVDIVVIDDGSEDSTAKAVAAVFAGADLQNVGTALLVHNPAPIYETACDNQGFVLARTEYVIEVQADISIEEPGYDTRLLRPLVARHGVSAVSGRLVHSYDLLVGRRGWREYPARRFVNRLLNRDSVGLMGRKIFSESSSQQLVARYYMGETAARGPWALRTSDLRELGYLDEANFFLGYDDHDFHRRMLVRSGQLPVYAPMRIWSPESHGATRRPRSGLNVDIHTELARTRTGSRELAEFLESYRPFFHTRPLVGLS